MIVSVNVSFLYTAILQFVGVLQRQDTDYTVLFHVLYTNVLHTVSWPRWQNNKQDVYFHGSPAPHISATQCTPDRDQDMLTIFPPHIQFFVLCDILPQMWGAQTCLPPPDPLTPSPKTAQPKRNDPRTGYHIAHPPPYIITHKLYLMCIGLMMRSQHPPHTNSSL